MQKKSTAIRNETSDMRDTFHPMFFERTSRIVVDYFKHFTIFFMWICLSRCVITPQKNQIRMNVFCVSVVHFLYFMFPMRRAIQSNSLDKFWCLMITIIITTTKTALSSFQSFSLCIKNWVKLKRRPICKRNIQKILYIQSIVKWYAFYWFFSHCIVPNLWLCLCYNWHHYLSCIGRQIQVSPLLFFCFCLYSSLLIRHTNFIRLGLFIYTNDSTLLSE